MERRSAYYTEQVIKNMPAGLERAILRVLSFRLGAVAAIKKKYLMRDLAQLGYRDVGERQVRQVISEMRKQGILIGSSAGKEPGYYMMDSWEEVLGFLSEEIDSRIKDLNESKQSLLHAAAQSFGSRPHAGQDGLF